MKRFMTVIVIIFLSLMWIRFWTGCDTRLSYKKYESDLEDSFLKPEECLDNSSNKKDIELKNNVSNKPDNSSSRKSVIKKRIVNYGYTISKVGIRKLYATCYSQYDGPVEAKGIYANNDMDDKLHKRERRIQRKHFTVALNPEMDDYHRALIQLPDGTWTHKYRFHVPDYNDSEKPSVDKNEYCLTQRILSFTDSSYFSVPRDRMMWKGRIDLLFTTAGKYATIKERQRYWARKNTHNWEVEIWEIQKIALLSDGSKKLVE